MDTANHEKHLVRTSKFLSLILRHDPAAIGLELDGEGWAEMDALLLRARESGKILSRELIEEVVRTNDKKRFAFSPDGKRIRAVQGHSSVGVAISYPPVIPPEKLYHGTATRFLESIQAEGLRPGDRHFVHLSPDRPTAIGVGQRHGKPVVLTVASGDMHRAGHVFHQAENGVWLVQRVPVAFMTFPDE